MQKLAILKEKKIWCLGINSKQSPQTIMTELFKALKQLGFEWKTISQYSLRCRSLNRERLVGIAFQLYKISEGNFLLDLKKLQGELFLFFDVCCNLYRLLSHLME